MLQNFTLLIYRIFDYILHFFKSAEWDAAVMGFIDNNCAIFVNDEENKFEYSEIHQAFVNKIEALIKLAAGPAFPGKPRQQPT